MRVVLDTNVYISALMNPESPPGLILRHWEEDKFTLCISEDSLAEISRVFRYPKVRRYLKQSAEVLGDFLAQLRTRATLFTNLPAIERASLDPNDDQFLALALAASADYLVSGDKHLLRLRHYKETWIVSPTAMLAFLSVPSFDE